MFKIFFLSELKYTLKQPMVYIFTAMIGLLVFGAVVSDNVQIGGAVGNVYRNSPYTITSYTSIMTIFGLLMATAFFNNAALRDYKNEFHEILFTTPLSKAGYFFGRFFGALLLSTIPLLGVFLGIIIGSVLAPTFGWIDAERYGSFYLTTFVNNYLLFILPNMFFAGAIIYAFATKWKSTIISFVGAMAIMIGYLVSGSLISDIDNETIGALSDIFGVNTYNIDTKYFTPVEKNTINPGFSGLLFTNRIIWIGIGVLVLFISYFSFSFKEKNKKVKVQKEEKKEKKKEKKITFALPSTLSPLFTGKTEWTQFKSFFFINFMSVIKSIAFKILFIFSVILLVVDFTQGYEYFGLQSYPITYKIIDSIDDSVGLFIVIILVFFSGELIWRDRDSKINEVVDATPHTSLISLTAKALSLVGITVILHVFFILCGVLYQLLNGYTRIELDVYFLNFIYDHLVTYFIWSGIMIMIQVVLNNKYIAYFVSILIIFIWSILLNIFKIESNMLSIGSAPSISYSDMNGFGPGLTAALWFNTYWVLFSFLCLLIAGALWNRGVISSLKNRISIAKKQVPKTYRFLIIGTCTAWIAIAGFVYYNTQVLNPYKTSNEIEVLSASYEKKYKKYEGMILPKVIDVTYFIDIYPEKRDVHAKSIIKLKNESNTVIDSLHFTLNEGWDTTFKIPNAILSSHDKEFDYLIYTLQKPILPNEILEIEIETKYITEGFKNGRGNTHIINNGTFLNNGEVLPRMGYNKNYELSNKNTRKKLGLPLKTRMPELEPIHSKTHMNNYLTDGSSDFINVETIISTSGDQIAIAPGSLLKKWKENDRNYYHYKVDQASLNFYSFISADYKIKTRKWNGIDIEVYYDSKHPQNVERMMDAVERSLTYYTKNFGPYFHKQCRIIEFPRYNSFAQAFPGTMPYSEAIGFVIDLENEEETNSINAVIAHEMGHQWWAHQVIGANMQGGTMMSESFAEYSSLMTLKSIAKTPMQMREFLKYNHSRYLRGRSGEIEKELPLYKVENQGYIHYGKGSVIMYALQDYIGEEKVNASLKEFLEEFKYKNPPYPSSLDFIKHLEPKVPDSLQYLIKDWLKEITLYDNRLKEATYTKLANGKYEVSMHIEAYKIKADSLGNETKVSINDWIDIGFFMDDNEEELLLEKRVKISQSKMNFTFELDSLPVKAAIDPRQLLIDRVYQDNIKNVEFK